VPGVVQPAVPDPRVLQQPLSVVVVRVRVQRATERLGEHVEGPWKLDPTAAEWVVDAGIGYLTPGRRLSAAT
jgi:hypothetical protein